MPFTVRTAVDIQSIKRIQKGQLTAKFERWKSVLHVAAPRSFSIVYGDDFHSLDLIADTEEEFRLWYKALKHLICQVKIAAEANPFQVYVQASFDANCQSPGGSGVRAVEVKGLRQVLGSMNIALSIRGVEEVVTKACGSTKTTITASEFSDIIQMLWRR